MVWLTFSILELFFSKIQFAVSQKCDKGIFHIQFYWEFRKSQCVWGTVLHTVSATVKCLNLQIPMVAQSGYVLCKNLVLNG